MTHKEVQQIAKDTLDHLRTVAKPGVTEKEMVQACDSYMKGRGIKSYWYHGLPVLLHAGERTILSQSASEYEPTDYKLKENDIITADTSPEVDTVWADYARTIILENGKVVENDQVQDPVFRAGLDMEDKLHAFLVENARPDMTYAQLHAKIDAYLRQNGFENLDFLNNFGHSIVEDMPTGTFYELQRDGRIFFDANSNEPLSSTRYFTFEPHIRQPGGRFGFKREDMYGFNAEGRLEAL